MKARIIKYRDYDEKTDYYIQKIMDISPEVLSKELILAAALTLEKSESRGVFDSVENFVNAAIIGEKIRIDYREILYYTYLKLASGENNRFGDTELAEEYNKLINFRYVSAVECQPKQNGWYNIIIDETFGGTGDNTEPRSVAYWNGEYWSIKSNVIAWQRVCDKNAA